MDLLLTSWAEDRPPPRRRRRIGGQLREVKEEPKKISTAQLLAYVNMKCTLMFSDLAVGVAIPVYLEVMRLDIGTLAAVRALAKSFDIIVSFIIGFASDKTRTPLGRRLPYIVVGSLFAPVAMWYLAAPPEEWNLNTLANTAMSTTAGLRKRGSFLPFNEVCVAEAAAASVATAAASASATSMASVASNCSALQQCVESAISSSALPDWQHKGHAHHGKSAQVAANTLSLSMWFLFFFVMRHSIGHTLVTIPYDALGQELTVASEERQRLFAGKSLSNFVGLLSAYIVQMFIALTMATDITAQAQFVAVCASVMTGVSLTWLVSVTRERPAADSDQKPSTPFLATIYALQRNRPYRNYLAVRLWLTFAFHLPFFSRLNYLKYVMGFENAALATTACAFVAQLTSFVALPLTMRFVKKSGKMSTMVAITTLASITNAAFALIPPLEFRRLSLYALQPVVEGFTQTALYTIPEMILADVIDYDELVYGERREGIFVVFDVNITQLMDILAAVLPGLILSALGYHGNGGCACGCGVKCPSSYLRWACPGDIGYACTSGLTRANLPFMGDAERTPPCTVQNRAVITGLQVFFYSVPALCFFISTLFSCIAPISPEVHARIREQILRRTEGAAELFDPITMQAINDGAARRAKVVTDVVDSFSESEQRLATTEGGVQKLLFVIIGKLLLVLAAIYGVIWVIMYGIRTPAARAIGIFASFMLFILVVWQVLKLVTLYQSQDELKYFGNTLRFERENELDPFLSRKSHAGSRKSQAASVTFQRRSSEDLTAEKVVTQGHWQTTKLTKKIGEAGVARVEFALRSWLARIRGDTLLPASKTVRWERRKSLDLDKDLKGMASLLNADRVSSLSISPRAPRMSRASSKDDSDWGDDDPDPPDSNSNRPKRVAFAFPAAGQSFNYRSVVMH